MSLTGRPSNPPFLLISSSQIFMPSSACLPLAASGPVSAMEKPIVTGWPYGAWAFAGGKNTATAAEAKNEATAPRHFSRASMRSSSWLMFDLGFLLGFLLGFFGDLSVFKVAFSSSPDLVGEFDDHAQFRPFLLLGQDIAFLGRGEAALRREAELLER